MAPACACLADACHLEQGYAVPSLHMPSPLIRLIAPLVPVFALVAPKLGKVSKSDGSKVTRLLGVKYLPIRDAAIEGAQSLMDRGLVKPTLPARRRKVAAATMVAAGVLGYIAKTKGWF